MTDSMITVALLVGDPAHEDLQLNEASLAAAARMIEVRWQAVTRGPMGTRAGAARSGTSTSSPPALRVQGRSARRLGQASSRSPIIWRPVGPAEVIRFGSGTGPGRRTGLGQLPSRLSPTASAMPGVLWPTASQVPHHGVCGSPAPSRQSFRSLADPAPATGPLPSTCSAELPPRRGSRMRLAPLALDRRALFDNRL